FVITSTGAETDEDNNYALYRVPTGTFYINRTANLLNVYISAIYGQGNYVDAVFGNQIYLNHKLIEQKRLSLRDVENRCKEILVQSAGVSNVYTTEQLLAGGNDDIKKIRNAFSPSVSGDIVIDVTPGWKLLNENTQETYTSRTAVIPFPIIIYGMGIKAERITTPVTVDRIAPTIAKSIHIRAPNACENIPLF
nr:alkaline phosphatase family protein [Prevotella sp.]